MKIITTDQSKFSTPKVWNSAIRGASLSQRESSFNFSDIARTNTGRVIASQEPKIIIPNQSEVDLLFEKFDFTDPSMRLWKYNDDILTRLSDLIRTSAKHG